MGAKMVFHGQANKKSVEIEFVSNKQAEDFVEKYKYAGEVNNFEVDYTECNKTRRSSYMKSSEQLFHAIMNVLYDDNFSWINYIDCRPKGKFNQYCINGWDSRIDPMRVKVLYIQHPDFILRKS